MKGDKSKIAMLAIIVFAFVGICYYLYVSEISEITAYATSLGGLEKTGQLGDSSGLLNALFSGLAFAGVLVTIIWQIRNDNSHRVQDRRDQFENTFFNLTQTFERIIEGLSVDQQEADDILQEFGIVSTIVGNSSESHDNTKKVVGRSVFQYIYQGKKTDGLQLQQSIEESGIDAYENTLGGTLDHYFRYLYRILKFIDQSDLIDDNLKYRYSSILRAQLSEYELVLIYYNGLSSKGKKLKPLLEKYSILKNLRKEDLANTEKIKSKYNDSAYKHILHYHGSLLNIVINSVSYSIILILLLAISKNFLNDILFKQLFSIKVLDTSAGLIVPLIIVMILLYGVQVFFKYRDIKVIDKDYKSKWDKFRYILSCYYDCNDLQMVLPIIIAFLYLNGQHSWYGYGFINYPMLIIL